MESHAIDWDALPEILSKEQFYRICHISKKTARHLLVSGKVPCKRSGKKTRCYQIRKVEVQAYLAKRTIFPEAYAAPSGLYRDSRKNIEQSMPPELLEELRVYFAEKLQAYPDVMRTQEIKAFTGYAKATVNGWCARGWLRHIRKGRANLIPKVFLLDFLCSLQFRTLNRKSDLHMQLLLDFYRWRAERTEKT